MNHSQIHELDAVVALAPIVVNNDTEGTGLTIDTRGAESCLFLVNIGISGDTLSGSLKHDVLVQHADTDLDGSDPEDGDFTTVTDEDFLILDPAASDVLSSGIIRTIDDAAEDPTLVRVAYVGDKPFVRVKIDTTGTHTNGTPMSALAVLGRLRRSVGGATPV